MKQHEVIIIGAGVAGLTCARSLQDSGRDFLIMDSAPRVGGRMKSDLVDGYRLDHGFQVLQSAYPDARKELDYDRLDLKSFPPGARIRFEGDFHVLADPLRKPAHFFDTLLFPIGTLTDQLKLIGLTREVCTMDIRGIFTGKERMSRDFLVDYGFSEEFIEGFFTPFLTGICLDPEIRVTQRFMLFVLRMFAQGDAALPALGMGEIPRQLAETIPPESLLLNSRVNEIAADGVILANGEKIGAEAIVLATPEQETARLLHQPEHRDSTQEYCLYFSADAPPVTDPFLVLNGEGEGLLNSVVFPSMVAPAYAPADKYLVAAVVPGYHGLTPAEIEQNVVNELTRWFGPQVQDWVHLKSYHIHNALPRAGVGSVNPYTFNPRIDKSIFSCSEMSTLPSIQWAIYSGNLAAQAVSNYLDATSPAFCYP